MRPLRFLSVCLSVMALPCLACQNGAPQGGTSQTTATSAEDSGSETGDPAGDGHGRVRIEPNPLMGDTSIFDGTTQVIATVHYESCLQDLYLATNPALAQDGVEGAPIFADWQTRLCTEFADSPACTVESISQTLIDANAVYSLSVTYTIEDPASLPYSEFNVGPLPTAALAGCADGLQPTVELRQTGLLGRDADGNQLWRISTLPASNSAVADQGAPLRVEVAPL